MSKFNKYGFNCYYDRGYQTGHTDSVDPLVCVGAQGCVCKCIFAIARDAVSSPLRY